MSNSRLRSRLVDDSVFAGTVRVITPTTVAATDTAALVAALAEMAPVGGLVLIGAGTLALDEVVEVPSNVTVRGAGRGKTIVQSSITPIGEPNNATFHAKAGAATATTALAANNVVGARTLSTNTSIAAGSIILINDTVSGAGLRTMSYDVVSVSGAGPYTVTLDRPVLIQYGTGDTVSVVPSQPTNIVLEDFSIIGSADRFIELVSAKNCIVRRINMTVTGGSDASYTFTANAGTDIITHAAHDIPTFTCVQVSSSGTLPAGLSASTFYWTVRQSSTTSKLATSYDNAVAGTTIDITDAGTGTHTIATYSHDIMQSFDVGGRGNLAEDVTADGGHIASDCVAQEGQEGTITRRCVTRRSRSYGIVMHDTVHAVIEDCHGSNHAFGLVITADGTTKGSIGTRVRGGSFTNCTTEGLSIVNGSTDTVLAGVDARFNPKALTCSNDIVNAVADGCDFSNHTTNAVAIGTGAVGIRLRGCDLSGTSATIPISAAGDLDLDGCRITSCKQIGLLTGKVTFRGCYLKCNPAGAQNVLYLSSGTPRVSLNQCELECATSSCNMVSIAAGVCTISQTTIKQVGGATGVLGMYISGGSLFIGSGVDASGSGTPLSSAGGTTKLVTETTVTTMTSPS